MDTLRAAGSLGLGSRLKRISDALFREVELIYKAHSITISPRVFAILHALSLKESIAVTELASMLRLTHPAIIQLARELEVHSYAKSISDKKDKRRTLFHITPKGLALLESISPIWTAIKDNLDERIRTGGDDLLGALSKLEDSLQALPLSEAVTSLLRRPQTKQRNPKTISIVGWRDQYQAAFEDINREWLSDFGFDIEEIDRVYFSNPKEHILKKGGAIFFALDESKVIGTCALLPRPNQSFELGKMGVRKSNRKQGIGTALTKSAIEHARARGLDEIYLETSSKLKEAINIYKNLGFIETTQKSNYARADITMVLKL